MIPPQFLPVNSKGGQEGQVGHVKEKEKNVSEMKKTRYIYKKLELGDEINVKVMKEKIAENGENNIFEFNLEKEGEIPIKR